MIGSFINVSHVPPGMAFSMPGIVMNSMAWHAQRCAAGLLPVAAQMGGFIPMAAMGQMAYGEFSVPNRRAAQFMLAQPQLVYAMQNYQAQHGAGRWGAFGRPCLSAQALNWMQGASCWNAMPASCSTAPIAFPYAPMTASMLDFNSCARTLNRVLNGSPKQSLSMQDMVSLANGSDPFAAEAARAFLCNPSWMQQIMGCDGTISRQALNRASISPQNAADARVVSDHMRSLGMNTMPSDAIMLGQARNMALPKSLRDAYARLMEGGEYSAYRSLEQFDVNKQPDGCSDRRNFDQAASYYNF